MSILNQITIEQALLNHGYLDGAGRFSGQIIRTATYAVKQTFARPIHTLTEKQIIWAYEKYLEDTAEAESQGYGCPSGI